MQKTALDQLRKFGLSDVESSRFEESLMQCEETEEVRPVVLWTRDHGFVNAPVRVPVEADHTAVETAAKNQLHVGSCASFGDGGETKTYLVTPADRLAFVFEMAKCDFGNVTWPSWIK